jgi:hypothetical protein
MSTVTLENRDENVRNLAVKIALLMREHGNRAEAIDAYDMAKILFRRPAPNRDLTSFLDSEESLLVRS